MLMFLKVPPRQTFLDSLHGRKKCCNKMMMKFSFCLECAMKLSFHFIVKSEGLVYGSKMCHAQWHRRVMTALSVSCK